MHFQILKQTNPGTGETIALACIFKAHISTWVHEYCLRIELKKWWYRCKSFALTFRPIAFNQNMWCPIFHYIQPVHLWGVAQVLILYDLDSSLQYLCGWNACKCRRTINKASLNKSMTHPFQLWNSLFTITHAQCNVQELMLRLSTQDIPGILHHCDCTHRCSMTICALKVWLCCVGVGAPTVTKCHSPNSYLLLSSVPLLKHTCPHY